jgi:ATP-dependent RNA helicase RhlE
VVFGGVGINPQVAALRKGVDVLVATPGRLLDHLQQKTVDLRAIEILVLDEADRMLDMGFIRDMRRILAVLPRERQTLLFSATFSDEIRSLAREFLNDPATVEVARRNTPAERVAQVVHPVDRDRKRALLAKLILDNNWFQVLVFTKTKHGANRLAEQLERDGIESAAIHGNKSQGARTRALSRFKDNSLRVLVATDIAARGLDIEALPHVVNYDLPNVPEDYVHRIGRTGRAGAEGEAISLLSAEDRPLLGAIEKLMGRRIDQRVIAGFEPGQGAGTPPSPGQSPARAPTPPHGRGRGHGSASSGGRPPAGRPQAHAKGSGPRHDGQGHRARDGEAARPGHAPSPHRSPRPAAAQPRQSTSDPRGGTPAAAPSSTPAPRPSGLFADRGSGRTRRR